MLSINLIDFNLFQWALFQGKSGEQPLPNKPRLWKDLPEELLSTTLPTQAAKAWLSAKPALSVFRDTTWKTKFDDIGYKWVPLLVHKNCVQMFGFVIKAYLYFFNV